MAFQLSESINIHSSLALLCIIHGNQHAQKKKKPMKICQAQPKIPLSIFVFSINLIFFVLQKRENLSHCWRCVYAKRVNINVRNFQSRFVLFALSSAQNIHTTQTMINIENFRQFIDVNRIISMIDRFESTRKSIWLQSNISIRFFFIGCQSSAVNVMLNRNLKWGVICFWWKFHEFNF